MPSSLIDLLMPIHRVLIIAEVVIREAVSSISNITVIAYTGIEVSPFGALSKTPSKNLKKVCSVQSFH